MGDWQNVKHIHQNVINDPQLHDEWLRWYKSIQTSDKNVIDLFTISEMIDEYKLLENSESTNLEELQFKYECFSCITNRF